MMYGKTAELTLDDLRHLEKGGTVEIIADGKVIELKVDPREVKGYRKRRKLPNTACGPGLLTVEAR
jgi:hypothetical protein